MNAKFQDERRTGIGGSDVASCFNLDRGCARRLVYEKRGTKPDYPDPFKPEYERGTALEPVAREKYQKETGRKVVRSGATMRDKDYQHMRVSIDGEIDNNVAPNDPGLLEIKTTNRWMLKKIQKEGLPNAYILQANHAMYVGNYSWGEFAVLSIEPWALHVVPMVRDEAMIATIIEREAEVWQMVTNGPWPDKLDPSDRRCQSCPFRLTCQGSSMMQVIPQEQQSIELQEDKALDSLAQEVWEAKDLLEQAEALYDDAKGRMTQAIGTRDGVRVTGGRFILTRSTPVRWDSAALTASLDLFPLLERYRKQGKPQVTLRSYRA